MLALPFLQKSALDCKFPVITTREQASTAKDQASGSDGRGNSASDGSNKTGQGAPQEGKSIVAMKLKENRTNLD